MDVTELHSEDLLHRLSADPGNQSLLDEATARFADHSFNDDFAEAICKIAQTGLFSWHNCIGEQNCHPERILHPTSIEDLVDAINKGRKQQLHVRAVGSGHSFSNVAPCFNKNLLLDPHWMKKVIDVDGSVLRDPSMVSKLFSVESGITIKKLNTALDKRKKALINMGAYDGQTLAGAISTGTHGTGITLGPMASSVRSLLLVSETGTVYQIEPSNGITHPGQFAKKKPNIILKQDDDCFNANVIAMGCMGLIYSYTLEVEDAYNLTETRSLDTWEAVKGSLPQLLKDNRHFEVDINPYTIGGVHTCIKIMRNKTPLSPQGSRGIANWISGILASCPVAEWLLVEYLNLFPTSCPGIINRALPTLVDTDYIDKSFEVMDLGAVDNVKAMALELAFDATNATVDASSLIVQIDKLLGVFAEAASQKKWYLAGPVALRFVAASDAFLAPQQGRPTCMAELDLLVGIRHGQDLLKEVKNVMCTKGSGVRVHWGLDLDTVTGKDVPDMFPMYDRWVAVYRQLNSTGIFDSPFTERLGISMGKK